MKSNNKKTKYITTVLFFILLTFCNIYLSVILHKILSKTPNWIIFESLQDSIIIIINNKGASIIFLGIETFIILGLIAAQISRVTAYKSELTKITDDIYIPKPAGENQYGSARFYSKKEINEVFNVITVNKHHELIKNLIVHGYDDLYETKENNNDFHNDIANDTNH